MASVTRDIDVDARRRRVQPDAPSSMQAHRSIHLRPCRSQHGSPPNASCLAFFLSCSSARHSRMPHSLLGHRRLGHHATPGPSAGRRCRCTTPTRHLLPWLQHRHRHRTCMIPTALGYARFYAERPTKTHPHPPNRSVLQRSKGATLVQCIPTA